LKLPYTGYHLAREKEADQEQHGGGQLHQNWRKWVFSMCQAQYDTKDRGRWQQIVDQQYISFFILRGQESNPNVTGWSPTLTP
jgi:hypothetical protein